MARLADRVLALRFVILGLALVLAGVGVWAFRGLPIDAFPDISTTQVKIILKAPGMTPEEVESRVITPIEMEMLGIPHQRTLRSMAKYAVADITIDFDETTDIYWARAQVAERLNAVSGDLPETVEGGLAPISTPLSDLYMFTLEGPQSLAEKRRLLDWLIRPALRTVPGVADVNALGGFVETFQVRPDAGALAAAGLTADDLRAAIEGNNRNDGAGRLTVGEEALIVRAVGAVRSVEDLATIVVSSANGRTVRIGDVAEVGTGAMTRYGAVTRNGQGETVQGLVLGLRGADASQVVKGVKARLDELIPTLPPGTRIEPFYDRSDLIGRAVGTVEKALLEATVLVVILLLIFLGNLRAALIVALALPMAALATFIAMRGFGLSANLMSLGGLSIAVGILVDGAVVVVENIVEALDDPRNADLSKPALVARAMAEVSQPVAAGMLIIALVFMPLLTLEGLEGKLFSPVALTIVLALLSALTLSLTLVPVLALLMLKRRRPPGAVESPDAHAPNAPRSEGGHPALLHHDHGGDHEPWLMRRLTPVYRHMLEAAFARPALVGALAGLGLALAVGAYFMTGKTFLPTMDEGSTLVQLTKLPSISLDHSVEGDLKVQKALMANVPEIDAVIARVGSDELGLDPMSPNETDSFLQLKPRHQWRGDKTWLIEQIRQVTDRFPGIEASFTQPIEMRIAEMLTGARGDLAIKVFGPDGAELARIAGAIEGRLKQVRGTTEAMTVANDSVDYLQLTIDRQAVGRIGMPIVTLQDLLRADVEGLRAGTVAEGARRMPIMIKGDGAAAGLDAFVDQSYRTPDGQIVRISDVARFRQVAGPVKIEHENGSRFALVQAFVGGRDLVGYVEEAKADIATHVKLPRGYRLVWGGQFENQQRASARLLIVLPVALALIFLVLLGTLRSVRAALLILVNIPFALVGGMVALAASGEYLSVPASVGFIALLGIAVLNGLVLVSYFRQLRGQGMALSRVVRLGAVRRLRPVLMTASIAAFGLVPLLFATGPGSEIQKPLAIVVIGGLISSTVLTLILLPMLYLKFGEARPGGARAS